MRNREILQTATEALKQRYPSLNAESMIAFMVIAGHDKPTVGDVAVAIQMPDSHVFQHMAPLRSAGLVTLQAEANGGNTILLTPQGEEAKQALEEVFAG